MLGISLLLFLTAMRMVTTNLFSVTTSMDTVGAQMRMAIPLQAQQPGVKPTAQHQVSTCPLILGMDSVHVLFELQVSMI